MHTLKLAVSGATVPLLLVTLAGCGDAGRASASDGASSDGPSSLTQSASEGATEPTQGSMSATGSTSTPTGSASNSAEEGTEESVSVSVSGTSTGDTDTGAACSDVPPPPPMGQVNMACASEPMVGVFDPVEEWTKQDWAVGPGYNNVMASPIVASFTDDNADGKIDDKDVPDIAFTTFIGGAHQVAGYLRVVSGADGAEILNIGLEHNICASAGVAAGDIDGDGVVELLSMTTAAQVKAFEHDGTLKWTSPAVVASQYAMPAISDMDGDGKPEIVVGATVLNSDGTIRGSGAAGSGAGVTSFAVDVDGDGVQEVVVGNALYRPDGSSIWANGLTDGFPAVADFELDGTPEIVVSGGGIVRMQSSVDGAQIWSVPLPGGGVGGPPTIADYDGDGKPEVGVAGGSAYVVFDGDGTVLWQQPTQDMSSSQTGSSVFDFEGDGIADVVYNDELRLWVYSGVEGSVKLNQAGHGSGTLWEYPLVVDVDGDGQSEIVVTNNNYAFGVKAGVTVIGDKAKSWVPGRKIWNQHAYHITNVNDDGTIPAVAAQSWKNANNFRSGDLLPPDGTAAPDLVVQLAEGCEVFCIADSLVLWVYVGNEGASPLALGATVEVYATKDGVETLVTSQAVPGPIAPGQFLDAIIFDIPATDVDLLRIAGKTMEEECEPGNNEVMKMFPFCGPAPG
jgi:hypothetical protein